MDITLLSAAEAAERLRRREFSPLELLGECLRKIEAGQARHNAFTLTLPDAARAAAREAEQRLLAGDAAPLCGLPFALKDLYHTRGIPTTGGSGMLRDFLPEDDSAVGACLRDAGAVLIGKTVTHEFAFGTTGDVSFHGPSRNCWNPERVCGGSSGGSAVAVGLGMAFVGMGTDSGGSVRIPASLCGVVGFKPTYGLLSARGIIPLSFTLDHPGPITRSVLDAALVLDAVVGPDAAAAGFADAVALADRLDGLTLAIVDNYFFDKTDAGVGKCFFQGVAAMERLGARIVHTRMPFLDTMMNVSSVIMCAEAAWVHRERLAATPGGFGAETLSRLEEGAACSAVDYIDAMQRRDAIATAWEEALRDVDAVLAPTLPIAATRLGERKVMVGGKEEAVFAMYPRHTRVANVTGAPALSVPCGFGPDGLPVGLMIMGGRGRDREVLRVGYAYEKVNAFVFP